MEICNLNVYSNGTTLRVKTSIFSRWIKKYTLLIINALQKSSEPYTVKCKVIVSEIVNRVKLNNRWK